METPVNTPEADEIYVLNRKVRLLQPPMGGFRTGLDSVMLGAACPAQAGERVLDMGCGVGGAGFCALWRVPGAVLTAVEWQQGYADLARQNAVLNGWETRVIVVQDDIRSVVLDPADHVICNPPYLEAGTHVPSPDELRAQALGHQKDDLTLEDWVNAAHRLVKSRGSFTIIYPAYGTDHIIRAMGRRFGAVDIFPLWPRAGVDAKRVVIRAIKDRQPRTTLHAGLVLHAEDGAYTPEADKVLRDGAELF